MANVMLEILDGFSFRAFIITKVTLNFELN